MKTVLAIAASLGCGGFFLAATSLALRAHHYKVLAQPMPNGKGGFMTYQDGYSLALVFLMMSVVWLYSARRIWRSREK